MATYVNPVTRINVMIRLLKINLTTNDIDMKIGLSMRVAQKDIRYAGKKVTIAIFHFGGAAVWSPGIANHVSRPVALS